MESRVKVKRLHKRITSKDIEKASFNKKLFGGYRMDEVDDFLEKVVEAFKFYEELLPETEKELSKLQARETSYEDMEKSLAKTMIVTQDTTDKLIKKAEEIARETLTHADEQADTKLKEAEKEAHRVVTAAKDEAERILREARDSEAETAKRVHELKTFGSRLHKTLLVATETQQSTLLDANLWEPFMPRKDVSVLEEAMSDSLDETKTYDSLIVEE